MLSNEAAHLADSYHWRRPSPLPHRTASTLRVTANDLDAGCIRLPNAKQLLPPGRAETTINLRGTILRSRWNARRGPPERSGTLSVGRHMLNGLVEANEALTITIGDDGRIELN